MKKSRCVFLVVFSVLLVLAFSSPRSSIAQSSGYSQSVTQYFGVPYLNPLRSGDATFELYMNVNATQLTDHTPITVSTSLFIPPNFINDSYPVSTDFQQGIPFLVAETLNNSVSPFIYVTPIPNSNPYAYTLIRGNATVQFTTDGNIGLSIQFVFSANTNVTDEMHKVAGSNTTLLSLLYDKLDNNTRFFENLKIPIEISSLQQAEQGQSVISIQSSIGQQIVSENSLIKSGNNSLFGVDVAFVLVVIFFELLGIGIDRYWRKQDAKTEEIRRTADHKALVDALSADRKALLDALYEKFGNQVSAENRADNPIQEPEK